MERTKKNLFQKAVSFLLVAALVFSTLVVGTQQTVSAADVSLKPSGGVVTISDENCSYLTQDYTWIKYTSKADGYLWLKFSSNSQVMPYVAGEVQLYDKNKNTYLSELIAYDTRSTTASETSECYGVKKNTVYYIRVNSVGGVKITAKFNKVNDKSGTKKSKALNLRKGKNTNGLITTANKKSHWYKFTTTKPSKFTFNITPYLTGPIDITLSGTGVKTNTFRLQTGLWGKKDGFSPTGKVRAGTYYVQIKPASKICNGYYKVSWK